jgi:hypothetical protein
VRRDAAVEAIPSLPGLEVRLWFRHVEQSILLLFGHPVPPAQTADRTTWEGRGRTACARETDVPRSCMSGT